MKVAKILGFVGSVPAVFFRSLVRLSRRRSQFYVRRPLRILGFAVFFSGLVRAASMAWRSDEARPQVVQSRLFQALTTSPVAALIS